MTGPKFDPQPGDTKTSKYSGVVYTVVTVDSAAVYCTFRTTHNVVGDFVWGLSPDARHVWSDSEGWVFSRPA